MINHSEGDEKYFLATKTTNSQEKRQTKKENKMI